MFTEFTNHFRAMGTDMNVIVVADPRGPRVADSLSQVEEMFRSAESQFSRFLPDSELSLMNAQGGSESPSEAMWDVLQRARQWWKQTGGVFDPTILPALESAGYDRSFEHVRFNARPRQRIRVITSEWGYQNVTLAESGSHRQVILEDGVRIDLGGIVKGWAVDRAGELLIDSFDGFLIDAGGDILARGHSDSEEGWWIAVENPFDSTANRGCVLLKDSALATSGTYRRRWIDAEGRRRHHIIDPRTGLPSVSEALSVTTCGPTVEACEVIAKSIIVDEETQLDWVEKHSDITASVVHADGSEYTSAGWEMLPIYPVDDALYLEVSV
ncbi:MAG: FAD:protein FMN transferase [SAR202 cluster bacterium]|jgi:thiamine biosynthesis lipoprotein|nr:FAD:protein FMN transferase [SAR202 cluster bacterium]MDP6512123.1 FAD:protein FMN transferase [SAR202 cluster bacterium]MDP6715836.1 FAD:protein FMN transferase [SAR202 cluster bacterium]